MRIIKHGKIYKKDVYNFVCKKCECEFEAFDEECKYIDCYESSLMRCNCPCCGEPVYIENGYFKKEEHK